MCFSYIDNLQFSRPISQVIQCLLLTWQMKEHWMRACLQDAGQLTISIGHMLTTLSFCEGSNYIAKRKQALIDLNAFIELLPNCSSILRSLAPCRKENEAKAKLHLCRMNYALALKAQ